MSKNAKAAAKLRRLEEKRRRKASQRAQYEKFRELGQNHKSKRAVKNSRVQKRVKSVDHPDGTCGNPGCIKCYGMNFKPFLDNNGSPMPHMPQWIFNMWKAA